MPDAGGRWKACQVCRAAPFLAGSDSTQSKVPCGEGCQSRWSEAEHRSEPHPVMSRVSLVPELRRRPQHSHLALFSHSDDSPVFFVSAFFFSGRSQASFVEASI